MSIFNKARSIMPNPKNINFENIRPGVFHFFNSERNRQELDIGGFLYPHIIQNHNQIHPRSTFNLEDFTLGAWSMAQFINSCIFSINARQNSGGMDNHNGMSINNLVSLYYFEDGKKIILPNKFPNVFTNLLASIGVLPQTGIYDAGTIIKIPKKYILEFITNDEREKYPDPNALSYPLTFAGESPHLVRAMFLDATNQSRVYGVPSFADSDVRKLRSDQPLNPKIQDFKARSSWRLVEYFRFATACAQIRQLTANKVFAYLGMIFNDIAPFGVREKEKKKWKRWMEHGKYPKHLIKIIERMGLGDIPIIRNPQFKDKINFDYLNSHSGVIIEKPESKFRTPAGNKVIDLLFKNFQKVDEPFDPIAVADKFFPGGFKKWDERNKKNRDKIQVVLDSRDKVMKLRFQRETRAEREINICRWEHDETAPKKISLHAPFCAAMGTAFLLLLNDYNISDVVLITHPKESVEISHCIYITKVLFNIDIQAWVVVIDNEFEAEVWRNFQALFLKSGVRSQSRGD